jgi:uncharacterized protein
MPELNSLCHVEYFVADIPRAQAFYEALFGWTFRAFIPDMVVFGVGDEHIGGLMKKDVVNAGDSPSLWFRVASLEKAFDIALAHGGTTNREVSPVPGVGNSAVVKDPDGNAVGLVEYVV